MHFKILKNRQRVTNVMPHIKQNTGKEILVKALTFIFKKCNVLLVYIKSQTINQISCPKNWNINIPLFVNRFCCLWMNNYAKHFLLFPNEHQQFKLCFNLGFLAINHIKAQILNGLNCYNNVWIPRVVIVSIIQDI